jgi:esterase
LANRILNHDQVVAGGSRPERWLYMLHGIFGSGRNWASLARRVVRERPEWGILLVDLRQHGGSQDFSAPHTIDSAAADLLLLAAATDAPPTAVLGHSFGGKVALAFAMRRPPSLQQVWVIDSTPEAGEPRGSAWQMLRIIQSLPGVFASRDVLVDALTSRSVERPVAQWMATNLEGSDDGFRWRFDLDALEALLLSFFETDAWSALEPPAPGLAVHLVKAEDSSVLAGESLERADRAARQYTGGVDEGIVQVHRVEGGHWVNAENPDAVVDLLVRHLP